MKKLIAIFVLSLVTIASITPAQAHDGFRGGYHGGDGGGMGWVGPALLGGVIGYELSRPRYYEPPVVVQQPVYIQRGPALYSPPIPGTPYGYHWEAIIDANTGMARSVLVPN